MMQLVNFISDSEATAATAAHLIVASESLSTFHAENRANSWVR